MDEFLVYLISADAFRIISKQVTSKLLEICIRVKRGDAPSAQKLNEIMLELAGEISYMASGILADDEHLAKMGLGLGMALEAVLISALLLTDLTVPPQAL